MKAWHLRPGVRFLTHANFERVLQVTLPANAREILVVVGEIDCREGIGPAHRKGKYATLQAAVDGTVDAYVAALRRCSARRSLSPPAASGASTSAPTPLEVYVLPVPPPADPKHQERARIVGLFNQTLRQAIGRCAADGAGGGRLHFADYTDKLGVGTPPRLRPEFNADGTHCSPAVVALLEAALP